MKGFLENRVQLVILQFIFSNIKFVPVGLFQKNRETVSELIARKSEVGGKKFIEPTEGVSLLKFLADLKEAGYILADAFFKMRTNARGKEYPVVRFIFGLEERDGEFAKHRDFSMSALLRICEQSLWQTEAYLNPYFLKEEVVKNQFALSINLGSRQPLIDGNGEIILEWKKDENGQRIGADKVPIEPHLFLRGINDDIVIISSEKLGDQDQGNEPFNSHVELY